MPIINNQESIIERIICYFPADLVVKFMYRSSIIDIDVNIQLTISEYQKKYILKLYTDMNDKHILQKEHINYLDMYTYDSNTNQSIHILIDQINNMVHLNSDSNELIQNSVHNLCKRGFIPIKICDKKTRILKKIFIMKEYSLYYLSGGIIFQNSNN